MESYPREFTALSLPARPLRRQTEMHAQRVWPPNPERTVQERRNG